MRWRLRIPGSESPVTVVLLEKNDREYKFQVGDEFVTLTQPLLDFLSIHTNEIEVSFESWTPKKWRATVEGMSYAFEPLSWGSNAAGSQNEIHSEMPGRILKVLAKPGDRISAKQPLVIMEAMKMENEIRAAADAVIKSVCVEAGQSVESGALLLELEPTSV